MRKMTEAATRGVLLKKGVLRYFTKFTGKHIFQISFLIKLQAKNFIKKGTLAQVFSCEFSKISKNTFFTETGSCFMRKINILKTTRTR